MAFYRVQKYGTVDPITSLTIPPIGAIFYSPRVNQGPARGSWIYNFYATGTSTPQNVYQDGALTTPFAPTGQVTADAFGRFPAIYLDNSIAYKVTLSNASSVVQQTRDPYNPAMATTGLAQVVAAVGLVINVEGELTMTEAASGGSGNELTINAGAGGALRVQGNTPGQATLLADSTVTTGAQSATFQASNRPGNELQYSLTLTAAPAGATYVGGNLTANFTGLTSGSYTAVLSTGQVITGCSLTNGSTIFVCPSTNITGTPSATFVATFSTGVSKWLPVKCDGVLYYAPLFHGNSFTVISPATSNVYTGQTISAAGVTFNSDGTVSLSGSGASATPSTYYSPPQAGIGTNTWIQPTVTNNGGLAGLTFTGAPVGSWTNIGSGLTVGATGAATLVGSYQLSSNSSGTPVVASGTITLSGGSGPQSWTYSPAGDGAQLTFNTNGTVSASFGATPQNWYTPTTTGIGSSYWVNFHAAGGTGSPTYGGVTYDTWLALSGGPYTPTVTLRAPGTGTVQYQISSNSAGTLVVAQGSWLVTNLF